MRRNILGKIGRLAMVAVSLMLAGNMSIKAEAATNSKDVSSYTAEQVTEDMKIGWNLGNSLDAMHKSLGYTYNTETIWGNPVTTKENIDEIAKAGFGAVRVPVSWYNHIDSNGKIDEKWLARVGEVVNYALDNDLYVIINIHHDAGMGTEYNWIYADTDSYETDKENFTSLWTQIAAYFKDYDEHLLFEATNEIMNSDQNWDWGVAWKDFRKVHDLDQEFINIVRNSGGRNTKRCLILSTWGASSDSCQIEQLFYKSFTDTVEDKLIMSVHNYSTSDSTIDKFMSSLASYSEKYDIPVIIDEFGTKASVALSTREKSAQKYISTAKEAGIVCFWWDNGGSYMIFNRKTNEFNYPTIVEVMMKALYGEENTTEEATTEESTAEEATTEENTTEEATTEEVTTEEVTTEESTAEEATTEESTAEEATTEESTAEEATTEESTTEEVTTEENTTEEATTEESTAEEATTEESTTEEATTEEVTTEERTTEKVVTEGKITEKTTDVENMETEGGLESETHKDEKEIEVARSKKGKILKIKNVKSKKIQLQFKKIKGYKYQIKICTSKKFKKNVKTYNTSKTTYTIKKLRKGVTYYVKVRTYKKINSVNVYGKWSAIKKVKIKK